eukprot:CAMPEP_0170261920 /NCGR_PEP_ID=MMETSP0116_2-20130129/30842_1 /TAXON_ID=400756 /ORGANISM="Durinskia baltica, Strain CSIRO CS-38" /LENGTH=91 /DNA_ID=CAMNT_0010512987 /DNA_START=197 /DNA_END=468 /DNA_ORIENTATION=+
MADSTLKEFGGPPHLRQRVMAPSHSAAVSRTATSGPGAAPARVAGLAGCSQAHRLRRRWRGPCANSCQARVSRRGIANADSLAPSRRAEPG